MAPGWAGGRTSRSQPVSPDSGALMAHQNLKPPCFSLGGNSQSDLFLPLSITFITGSPACCVMPDILHVCHTGISISHFSESGGYGVILNKSGDHLAQCSQSDFTFTSKDASLFMLVSFPVHPLACLSMCSYLWLFFPLSFSAAAVQFTLWSPTGWDWRLRNTAPTD